MTKPLMIYAHSPFCHHHCPYCDFFVIARANRELIEKYMAAMTHEIGQASQDQWDNHHITSIFLGGGTPSLLEARDLERQLNALAQHFRIQETCEITLETNPEDITFEKSKAWAGLGINRISLGVQSLNPQELNILERQHTPDMVYRGIDDLCRAGFLNISVDVMFALPGQNLSSLRETLKLATSLPIQHLSAYNLTIEERTRYKLRMEAGTLALPDEETQHEMYTCVRDTLTSAGFLPYEISNFAKGVPFQSTHNKGYWNGQEYWGLGVGAHSFQKQLHGYKRWWNNKNLHTYLQKMSDRTTETLDPLTHFKERLFTGFRQTQGISLQNIAQDLNISLPSALSDLISELLSTGHMAKNDSHHYLTPAGIVVSDEIFARIHHVL